MATSIDEISSKNNQQMANAVALTSQGGDLVSASWERHIDALEVRLQAAFTAQQVQHTAELHEVDKLAEMASKNAEARIAAGERRQKRLEEYLSEITSTVARLCRESQERWTLGIADGESLQRQVQVLEDRCLELPKLAMERTAFEERMKAVEACCMDLPEVKVRLKTLEDHAMVSPDKDPSESKQKKTE